MSEPTLHRLVSLAAFAVGLAVVAVGLAAWRMPAGDGRLGLDVQVLATSSGELRTPDSGAFVSENDLEPGHAAAGRASFVNETGARLIVRARALPDNARSDRALWIEVDGGAAPMYRGPLGGLRALSGGGALLRPSGTLRLSVHAWIPASTRAAYRGQIVDVPLELVARRAP